ncbi:major facilitator superfamily domain-containing protein [Aspergillus pseudoustus]|uniref:Major facilitator superfamily domain-containing protein n=1 Tax=Aspergillus pseudoustus TaxID=1810923 RepID=A0ABR4JGW9_9EURO
MNQERLHHLLQTAFVVFPAFFLFGYCQVVVGALVSFEAFTRFFPQLDTLHSTGVLESHRSLIQGVYNHIGAVLTLVGPALSCSAFHLLQLFVGRILTEMGVGIFSATVPAWQSECSPPMNRGRHVQHDFSWRVPRAVPAVFSIILCSSIFFFPESPRWLVSVGKITQQITAIEVSIGSTASHASSYRDIFTMKMTGAQVISTYPTVLFKQNLDLSDGATRVLIAAIISQFRIDHFGRRILFLICGAGIASSFFVFLFNFFFLTGFLRPSFLYCTEVASSRLRIAVPSISTTNHWLSGRAPIAAT